MNILSYLGSIVASITLFFSSLFGGVVSAPDSQTALAPEDAMASAASATSTVGQKAYSDAELLAMARDAFSSGVVPLGDYKYVTSGAKKGYVYLCNARKDNAGSMVVGPWVTGSTWNLKQKVSVAGSVTWKNASFSDTLSGTVRTLTGNDLPINHPTGVFPIASSDPAHQYDANPNTISSQQLKVQLPAKPTYSSTPYCMGSGEVGIMTTGVALFNAFDAGLRDAPAHELQDTCGGHPQEKGEYHYHSLPSCLKDTSVKTVIGYAYDGFPITGPVVEKGKYLTTSNLDECHGITSEILLDGKKTISYHYVMTYDFPYSASCFRGKSVSTGPSAGAPSQPTQQGSMPSGGTPPQEALTACSAKSAGGSCSFTGGRGETISGTCQTPQGSTLACVPR
jgi:YHYH protein